MITEGWPVEGRQANTNFRVTKGSYKLIVAVLAILYGLILAGLPVDEFKDRENYINYVGNSEALLEIRSKEGIFPLLANEPLWLLMNATAANYLDAEQVVRLIIFLSASTFSYLMLSQSPSNFWWLLAFLFLPQILKNYVVHLRQGMGISIFFLGWTLKGDKKRWAVLMLTPFIHASFFFVIALVLIIKVLARFRFSQGVRALVYIAVGIGAAISTAFIAELLGARQILENDLAAEKISGIGFAFWMLILFVFLSQGRHYLRIYSLAWSMILFYLCTYYFIDISGRIFESTLFIVLLAGLQMKKWGRIVFASAMLGYGVTGYLLRLGLPWLGFGQVS